MNDEIDVCPPVDGLHDIFCLVVPSLCVGDEGEAECLCSLQAFFNTHNVAAVDVGHPFDACIVRVVFYHVAACNGE